MTSPSLRTQAGARPAPRDGRARQRSAYASARRLEAERFADRIWTQDPTLWKKESEEAQGIIRNSLGWLRLPAWAVEHSRQIAAFDSDARRAGFRHAVALGMGGSSLAPYVFQTVPFPARRKGVKLSVLDSIVPAEVRRVEAGLDLRKTLFIVSSKSGTTVEPNSLFKHFHDRVRRILGREAALSFAAITDPGTPLERQGREQGFREIFLNPADVGGRFSALSYFGLVPAALSGLDLNRLLDPATKMERALRNPSVAQNPGLALGTWLGACHDSGQDKLILAFPSPLRTLGLWIEQLIAESTGKEGRGILPVVEDSLGKPESYGRDSAFIGYGVPGPGGAARGGESEASPSTSVSRSEASLRRGLDDFESRGHPVFRLALEETYDLGAEFLRWEFAAAAAGFLMGINPFDQPDVQEAKELAQKALGESLPEEEMSSVEDLKPFLAKAGDGDYIAFLAYIEGSKAHQAALARIRSLTRRRFRLAAAVSFGPRYLHSSGQFHKGGRNNGLFVLLAGPSPDPRDLPIPGERFTFGELARAQARGDRRALGSRGRRVLYLEAHPGPGRTLEAVLKSLEGARPMSRGTGVASARDSEVK